MWPSWKIVIDFCGEVNFTGFPSRKYENVDEGKLLTNGTCFDFQSLWRENSCHWNHVRYWLRLNEFSVQVFKIFDWFEVQDKQKTLQNDENLIYRFTKMSSDAEKLLELEKFSKYVCRMATRKLCTSGRWKRSKRSKVQVKLSSFFRLFPSLSEFSSSAAHSERIFHYTRKIVSSFAEKRSSHNSPCNLSFQMKSIHKLEWREKTFFDKDNLLSVMSFLHFFFLHSTSLVSHILFRIFATQRCHDRGNRFTLHKNVGKFLRKLTVDFPVALV